MHSSASQSVSARLLEAKGVSAAAASAHTSLCKQGLTQQESRSLGPLATNSAVPAVHFSGLPSASPHQHLDGS